MHTAFNLPYVHDHNNKIVQATSKSHTNHENDHVRSVGQGEARHRISVYKRLKLGGQAYDRSGDYAAAVS
jgi:hypothetical protein